MGEFNTANVEVTSSGEGTVSFRLKQPFGVDQFSVLVYYPDQPAGKDLCWFSSAFGPGESHDFSARCGTSGFARVSVYGGVAGSSTFNQTGVSDYVPDRQCQSDVAEYPEFNPLKRCYWELNVPCDCKLGRKLVEEIPGEKRIATPDVVQEMNDGKIFERFLHGIRRKQPLADTLKRHAFQARRNVSFMDLFLRGAKVPGEHVAAAQGSGDKEDLADADSKQNEPSNRFALKKAIRTRLF